MDPGPWDEVLGRLDPVTVASAAGARFGAEAAPELVSTGANLVFRFVSGGAAHYLKVIHAALRPPEEVRANAAFHAHLHAAGAPVPRPLPSRAGRLVEALEQDGEPYLASAAEGVPGRAVAAAPPEYAAWGRALGELHRAAEGYAPGPEWRFRTAEGLLHEALPHLPAAETAARATARRLESWLATLPRDAGCFGLTHADCNRTNALFDGERVRILDFDEPVWHWFAADVARPWRELSDDDPRQPACLAAFLRGYRSERRLADRWVEAIPDFVSLKNVEMLAWDADPAAWAGDALPGGRDRSEELARIRRSFERRVD